ncbi:hypothetical protein L596_003202 [Steinernema carpocapsae]|uniref:BPTI/Kunitz inhibitor domain-containing protein n=1 Tax=Steinernema carpocapsae TaxID=34508 RepID=A0A4U8URQ7_STECR|nr:hypothetical protein L596_003202 [Steinernema carpocapsae]
MGRLFVGLCLLLCQLELLQCLLNYGREGDACNRNDGNWYAVPNSKHHFIYCHPKHGIYVKDKCAIVNGQRKVFDAKIQQCVASSDFSKATYHPMSSLVRCSKSTDCLDDKWFCGSKGRCLCRGEYVQIGTQCWKKFGINEGQCHFDQQCSSVWPTAKCLNEKCACPAPFTVVSTYHGLACTLSDECPMGSKTSVLLKTMNCHVRGGCGTHSNLEHLFDCVQFSSSTSMCCPNRAYTCMQPVMPGNGPGKNLRYYYDDTTDRCTSFIFRGGSMINTNVFQSKHECEVYCKAECPRGLVEKSPEGRALRCSEDGECGRKYSCFKQDVNGDGVCCPSKEWICSNEGGVTYNSKNYRTAEFDQGTVLQHVSSVFYPVIRYFYSRSEQRCKAFLFQGEGGNFNQFLTIEQCKNFCSAVTCNGDTLTVNGKTVSCTKEDLCIDGYVCTYGVCCREKDAPCIPGYEPLEESGFAYGSESPKECARNADCPLPYVCQPSNRISRENNKGHCCRKKNAKLSKLKPQEHFQSVPNVNSSSSLELVSSQPSRPTLAPSTQFASTTARPPPPPPPTSRKTIIEIPVIRCPSNRTTLIDEHGSPSTCDFSNLAPSSDFVLSRRCGGSADHKCAFANLNSTSGVCCSEMEPEQHRCPKGLMPLLDSLNQKVKICSPLLSSSCQAEGSYCVFDELFGSYHCCRNQTTTTHSPRTTTKARTSESTTVLVTEPSVAVPVTTVKTTTPVTTTTEITTTLTQENYQGCEFAKTAFNDPLSGGGLICQPNTTGACPPGFQCYFSKTKHQHQCCGITSVCSSNSAAYISPVTMNPVSCSDRVGCPKGFFCFFSNNARSSTEGVCCSEDPIASLCDQGLALRNNEGHALKCGPTPCPGGYNCFTRFNISICCPTNQNVCHQRFHQGLPCEEAPPQAGFFFDAETKACHEFTYSGCGGNDNRFDSKADCHAFCKSSAICSVGMPLLHPDGKIAHCSDDNQCLAGYGCTITAGGNYCCPKPEMTCSLPMDQGEACLPGEPRRKFPSSEPSPYFFWYFSFNDFSCSPFEYKGCGGNFNRFSTQKHCNMACAHALCPAGNPKMNGGNIVKCSQHQRCGEGYVCMRSAAGINDITICCPKPELVCDDRLEPAVECVQGQVRYKYNSNLNQCSRFENGGCLSSDNSFSSRAECDAMCISYLNQCPDHHEPYIDKVHKRQLICSIDYESCPPEYSCVPGRNGLYNYCCAEERCPEDQAPLLGSDGNKVTCIPGPFGFFDACHADYSCTKMATGRQICCPRKVDPKDVCPYPSRPFVHTLEGKPMTCGSEYSRCPFGYVCLENRRLGEHYCCSDLGDLTTTTRSSTMAPKTTETPREHKCEDGSAPLTDHFGTRICNPHLPFSCPEGYHCVYNEVSKQNQCCHSSNHITDRLFDSKSACPAGMAVRPHPTTNQPIVCQPEVFNYCPRHSQCEYSGLYWQYICCISLSAHEFYDIPSDSVPSKVLYPGDGGCHHDTECQLTDKNAKCHDWVCVCPFLLIHDRKCVSVCPDGFLERNGRCATKFLHRHP